MQALILSYLYLYIDSNPQTTEVGAGDLATSNLFTGLSDGKKRNISFNSTHALISSLYNEMVKGSLPGFILKMSNFFIKHDRGKIILPSFHKADRTALVMRKTLNDLISVSTESIINYHYLWFCYINGRNSISVFCSDCEESVSAEGSANYKIPVHREQFHLVERLRNNTANGSLLEGDLNGHPCLNTKIINTFKIQEICFLIKSISENSNPFLKMMKYVIQSPVYIEDDDEYLSIFRHANVTFSEKGYFLKENKVC